MNTRVRILLVAAAGVFLCFSTASLPLPGLQYDEVLFANAAMGNVDGTFLEWGIRIGSRTLPVMLMPYLGATKALLYTPIFSLFGGNAASVRIPVILLGLISIVLLYFLLKSVFDRSTAVVGLLLFASDPAFIFINKLDWGPVAIGMTFRLAVLLLLWRWLKGAAAWTLYLGCFLLGAGLYDKIVFAWFLVALPVAACLCCRAELRKRFTGRSVLTAAAAFLLGAAPLIAYNIHVPLGTLRRHGVRAASAGWAEDARYRYDLFRMTLDGSAVLEMVTGSDPVRLAALVRRETGTPTDRAFGWLFRSSAPTRTPGFYFTLIAAAGLAVMLRTSPSRRTRFFLLLTGTEALLIALTPEATGAHHAASVFPFTHILTACFLVAVYRKRPWSRGPALALGAAVLAVQVSVDLTYLKAFEATGGTGKWSDAIYRLNDFARKHDDRPLLLMDWGFSNQLLALSGGKVRKEEAFVTVQEQTDDEKKIQALYPCFLSPRALYIFHMPRYENFPTFDMFQHGLQAYGLQARVVEVFSQRDGAAVYFACEVPHPEVEEHLRAGRYFQYIEAEEYSVRRGGGVELRSGASRRKMLGETWGRHKGDFVTYRFALAKDVPNLHLYVRYAFESAHDRACDVRIDGIGRTRLALPWAGTRPGQQDNWEWTGTDLGPFQVGTHEIELIPVYVQDYANLDAIYLSEGELLLKPVLRVETGGRTFEPTIDLDVLGYQDRSNVRLEIGASELVAGSSTLKLRVVNLAADAIDVQYTLDGRSMPLIYRWRLDADRSTSVALDRNTAKGEYRFVAVRDSADSSPTAWIRVNACVRVR